MKEPPPLPPPPDPNPFANQPGRHMDFSASRALHRSSSLSPLLPDLPGVPLCPPASYPPVAHTTTPFSFKENGSPSNTASLPEGIEKVTGHNTLDGTTNESVTWSSVGKIPDSKAKVTISPEGRPRVKIPQAVFERGAKLHSDYIVGIFYGKPPSYGKIWGVLNFLWGKDRRVTIQHLAKNAYLFHIPSPSLRRKVLEHELWRVGDSPFFVTQWKSEFSYNPPALDRAPVWTTISGIPFDLITPEGLGFICRPLGKAVDYKPFKSVTSAEVKIIVNLTKPLPKELEVECEDGKVLVLQVTYPWLPPLCPLCNEIGHKKELCPSAPPSDPPKNKSAPKSKSEWTKVSHDKRKQDKVKETHKPPTPQVVPTPPVSVKGKEAVMEEAVSTNFSEPISLDPQPSFSHLGLPRSEEILEEVQITLNQCRVGDGSTSTTTVSNSFAALCSEEAMAEDIEHSPLAMVIHNPKAHNSSVSPNRKRLKRQRASPSPHSSPGTGGVLLLHGGYRHSTNL
ncbi:hypothetical protein IGI04_001106 [Brassica rapa subsp. trilocularis]|uniref:DUF4283 domain-containing protein n=1 Tax=Brassica rapa subsp. trilocularis TaxID=1813537 RepID=A0ABQ7NRP1_BRACM|nr:hypothetical protein IGI04_001106 [Brassica rapa subsp. trilocularis]